MKTVLIFEGISPWNDFFKRALSAAGYRVKVTRSALSLSHLIENHQPDLLLIGLGMEHEQRWHLFRSIRQHHEDLPVLMYQIASVSDVRSVERCVAEALMDADRKARPAGHLSWGGSLFVQAAGYGLS